VQIHLPALRERDEDVLVLARAFLNRFATETNKPGLAFAPDTLRALRQHGWPGNVRELQNRVKRGVIMCEGKRLTPQDLELTSSGTAGQGTSLKEARESLERDMIRRCLRKHSGRITSAAIELGISRPTLYELLEKLGIERGE